MSAALFVSDRVRNAWGLRESIQTSLVPVCLFRWPRRTVRDDYWWVNVKTVFSIMDETLSTCVYYATVIGEVTHFVVDWSKVPDQDLFICREVYAPVFSKRIVEISSALEFTGVDFVEVDGGRWPA